MHDHLVRNARFPWNDRRAFDRARRLELRSAVASAVSAELRARDARNAQRAMTKKSPSEKEKSETVRARVADEATMVAMPVIVRATRRRFTPGTVSRTTTMTPSLFRSSLRDVLAHAPSGVRTASHHPTSQMPTRADTEDGGEAPPVPLRQVLIPVDGTPQGEFMVDWVRRLAVLPDVLGESEFF